MDTTTCEEFDFCGKEFFETPLLSRVGKDLLLGIFILLFAEVFVGLLVLSGGVLLIGVPLQLLGLASIDQVAHVASIIVLVGPMIGMIVFYLVRECIAARGTTLQVLPQAVVEISHEGIRDQTETIVRIGKERFRCDYSAFLDERKFVARNIALRMPRSISWRTWLIRFRLFGTNDTFMLR